MSILVSKLCHPWRSIAEAMLGTLYSIGLSSSERSMVQASLSNKYVPALRSSFLAAMVGALSVLFVKISVLTGFLASVVAVTGIAWYTINLKDVKEKFATFGIELTRDMLKAFLTSLYLLGIVSSLGLVMESVIRFQSLLVGVTISLPIVLVIWWTIIQCVRATIKFDANDAMLTGTSDAALQFYRQALSELRNAADTLTSEHHLHAANLHIVTALRSYNEFLTSSNRHRLSLWSETDALAQLIMSDQREFDQAALPILVSILQRFRSEVIGDDTIAENKVAFVLAKLQLIEHSYADNADFTVDQPLADSIFALSFQTISWLLETFQDELPG